MVNSSAALEYASIALEVARAWRRYGDPHVEDLRFPGVEDRQRFLAYLRGAHHFVFISMFMLTDPEVTLTTNERVYSSLSTLPLCLMSCSASVLLCFVLSLDM